VKILLLEDDTMLADLVLEHLEEKGYDVTHFIDGEEAETSLLSTKYDLLLLDVNVPGISGFELLESLRSRKDMTPVIMITSRNSSIDLKEGFDLGCDDYIRKPFEFEELDARIEHIVRIYGIEKRQPIRLGENLYFDVASHTLQIDGRHEPLTPKAAEILHYLYKHHGRIVSREELLQNIWNFDEQPTDATLRSYIKVLRKFVPNIITERGVGYGFKLL